jgi:hypothetical protein
MILIVETLFLAVVFVAVPAGLDVQMAIGGRGQAIDIARRACIPAGFALAISLVLPPGPIAFLLAFISGVGQRFCQRRSSSSRSAPMYSTNRRSFGRPAARFIAMRSSRLATWMAACSSSVNDIDVRLSAS